LVTHLQEKRSPGKRVKKKLVLGGGKKAIYWSEAKSYSRVGHFLVSRGEKGGLEIQNRGQGENGGERGKVGGGSTKLIWSGQSLLHTGNFQDKKGTWEKEKNITSATLPATM